jgi:hypothetical protein
VSARVALRGGRRGGEGLPVFFNVKLPDAFPQCSSLL